MNWKAAALSIAGLALVGGQLSAAPITGTLNISGSVIVISDDAIDWTPSGGGTGIVNTVEPGTGYFSNIFNPAVVPAFTATVRDLPGANPFLFNFTAPTYSGLTYNMNSIITPTDPDNCASGDPGVNESCTLGVFLLTNAGGGNTTVTLKIDGTFQDPTTNRGGPYEPTYYVGTYTTQLAGRSITSIVQDITQTGCSFGDTCDGQISASYSANFAGDNPIPEPGTIAMMLGGLALVAGSRLRRRRS